ncbi:response regulator [Stieleria sp. TO1_6]|uniref:response regulator n=1 Tax=Stieleria tagensis TaxID=2956795 RepID=UPI00209B4D22|nr:response regulator [Stieleria tagensis]MCO8124317.1 response regulator [Stieleria tagensis]
MLGSCLVVDDVRSIRRQVVTWMSELGFECRDADNGAGAWELLQQRPVNLVVTDIDMPVSSGFDLLQSIRSSSDDALRQTAVLVISSLRDHEIEPLVRQQQANAFVMKPLDKSLFVDAVFRTLRDSPAWGSFPTNLGEAHQISPRLRDLVRRAQESQSQQ